MLRDCTKDPADECGSVCLRGGFNEALGELLGFLACESGVGANKQKCEEQRDGVAHETSPQDDSKNIRHSSL
jgi:hypothetical protein